MTKLKEWWAALPYSVTGAITRAVRVLIYGLIPTLSAYILTGDLATFEASLRVALSAAILALIDKAQREVRVARKANADVSGPADPGDPPVDGVTG